MKDSTFFKFFIIYSFDPYNRAHARWSPVGAFKALAPSCTARSSSYQRRVPDNSYMKQALSHFFYKKMDLVPFGNELLIY